MKKKIFIVEDNPDIGYILHYFLEDEGFEVTLFDNASSFNHSFERDLPDILLLDVMLPDGDGIQICDDIKSKPRTAHLPILIMSAHAPAEKISAESCANGFISKPFDLELVLSRVHEELGIAYLPA